LAPRKMRSCKELMVETRNLNIELESRRLGHNSYVAMHA
jgi:hypothetical protein